jgi:hypothetical protein
LHALLSPLCPPLPGPHAALAAAHGRSEGAAGLARRLRSRRRTLAALLSACMPSCPPAGALLRKRAGKHTKGQWGARKCRVRVRHRGSWRVPVAAAHTNPARAARRCSCLLPAEALSCSARKGARVSVAKQCARAVRMGERGEGLGGLTLTRILSLSGRRRATLTRGWEAIASAARVRPSRFESRRLGCGHRGSSLGLESARKTGG